MGNRRKSRERALQLLFQWDIHGAAGPWLEDFWTQHAEPPDVREFADRLVEGVRQHLAELDALIGAQASNWKVSRMPVVDRNILRAAVYELLWMPDVPARVTLNEAIELAKGFADEETAGFVNGVLDKILKVDARLGGKRAEAAAEAAGTRHEARG